MYQITIRNSGGVVLEILEFAYVSEVDDVAEAFENLTDYKVVREWEEE